MKTPMDVLYNCNAGKTALVVGNGPSLREVPPEFLTLYDSFGSNRIYLLDGFTPTYYACVNPLVILQNAKEIGAVDSRAKFVREGAGLGINGTKDYYELHSVYVPLFSYNPGRYIFEGYTVTFVALQLAFFMGYKTVLLVGVDHRYTFDGDPNEQRRMTEDDPNHFAPEYFRGQDWNNPDLHRSALAYTIARNEYAMNGRKIINLTPGTALDVFEKGDLNDWL